MADPVSLFDLNDFGRQLRVRMAERHVGIREAAIEMGVDKSTLSRVAHTRGTPDVENYLRMSRWLLTTQERP